MDEARRVLARVRAVGGRLRVVAGNLKYEGPPGQLTDGLRSEIRRHKAALVETIGPSRVSEMVAYLCDRGVLLTATDEVLGLALGHDPRLDDVDLDVLDELSDRHGEVVEWLRRPTSEMPTQELCDMGFAPHFEQRPADTVPFPLPDDDETDGRLSREVLDDLHNKESFARGVRAINEWFSAIERHKDEVARIAAPSPRDSMSRGHDSDAGQEKLW